MASMSDKEAAVFYKKHADYLENELEKLDKESIRAIRALCRTLGIDPPGGGTFIPDCIKAIDAAMKKRLAGNPVASPFPRAAVGPRPPTPSQPLSGRGRLRP